MYRNRLVRAYLGASRLGVAKMPEDTSAPRPAPVTSRALGATAGAQGDVRQYDPFTGFDPNDNVLMKDLPKRPFHIVNMALNLVGGNELAPQDRKALSFTASPLHCGYG